MAFKYGDNVIINYYGTKYLGTVDSVVGDQDNPTHYQVRSRAYERRSSKGVNVWSKVAQQEVYTVEAGRVEANPSAGIAGFAGAS